MQDDLQGTWGGTYSPARVEGSLAQVRDRGRRAAAEVRREGRVRARARARERVNDRMVGRVGRGGVEMRRLEWKVPEFAGWLGGALLYLSLKCWGLVRHGQVDSAIGVKK